MRTGLGQMSGIRTSHLLYRSLNRSGFLSLGFSLSDSLGGDQRVQVNGKTSHRSTGDREEITGGNKTDSINGDLKQTIGGEHTQIVSGDNATLTGGEHQVVAAGGMGLGAGGDMGIASGTNTTVRANGGTLTAYGSTTTTEVTPRETDRYDLGTVRSLKDFEKYAGFNFKNKSVQKYTIDNQYPPNPYIHDDELWDLSFMKSFYHLVKLYNDMKLDIWNR